LDPVRELPYRLAALIIAASKAGQMAASDYRVRPIQNITCAAGGVHRWKADIQAEFIRVPSYGFRDGHDGGS